MQEPGDPRAGFEAALAAIESAYEYMLAWAAQGREREDGPGPAIRQTLAGLDEALGRIGGTIAACMDPAQPERAAALAGFLEVTRRDAAAASAAARLVLSTPQIGAQLVDNLNASSHLRALLTDLYVIDAALGTRAAGSQTSADSSSSAGATRMPSRDT